MDGGWLLGGDTKRCGLLEISHTLIRAVATCVCIHVKKITDLDIMDEWTLLYVH